jgi:hypothetical protein
MEERALPATQLLGAGLPAGLWVQHAWRRRGPRAAVPVVAALLAGTAFLAVQPSLPVAGEGGTRGVASSEPLIWKLGGDLAHRGAALGSALAALARKLEGRSQPSPADEPQTLRLLGRGEASWYAAGFEGRPTASGETYRAAGMTAAHRTLPFGSLVRVTNLRNGRSVVVRVNDRGPYHARRVVDLSRAAAAEIGMMRRGRANVRLELLAAASRDQR